MIDRISIDLSNYCSKQCSFCYNHSTKEGNVMWKTEEVKSFVKDCIEHGIKAVSLGGGEPFEYDGIFELIDYIQPLAYLSITSNGLPLLKNDVWKNLIKHQPDKIHITIHNPEKLNEVRRVIEQISSLKKTPIKPGVNLLVERDNVEYCKMVYEQLISVLTREQIILIPQRFSNTPRIKDLTYITNGNPFQSPSCLLECKRPQRFVSISWDKKVNNCSFAGGKQKLQTLDFCGMKKALEVLQFGSCVSDK